MPSLPLSRYYRTFFFVGAFLLIVPGIVHAYLLMPFWGSQDIDAIGLAYFLEKYLLVFRIVGFLLVVGPAIAAFTSGVRKRRISMGVFLIFCISLTLLTDIAVSAEHMFQEPKMLLFADSAANKVPLNAVVIGVEHNGVAKAYPIDFIGYHHKVQDSVGDMPVLVTYCTMCRTARVYNPVIDGVRQQFRLVGARHYNTVIEDSQTRSWWYQTTGEAAVGPRKGSVLHDIPYDQVTLRSWLATHPGSLVMQADTNSKQGYLLVNGYDTLRPVEKDSVTGAVKTWEPFNWVVGIEIGKSAKAYEWNDLLRLGAINDVVGGTPLLLIVEGDSLSYHAFKRSGGGGALTFARATNGRGFTDTETGSLWDWRGVCVEGTNAGKKLEPVEAHQEFWRAWKQFHQETEQWRSS
jgi:hypothetical protein